MIAAKIARLAYKFRTELSAMNLYEDIVIGIVLLEDIKRLSSVLLKEEFFHIFTTTILDVLGQSFDQPERSWPVLSCPVLSSPVLASPVLACPVQSCPDLVCPVLTWPVQPCPVLLGAITCDIGHRGISQPSQIAS